jgi:L-arabinose isomerase
MLMQWIGMAVQAGEISIPDAMDIMLEPDLTVAVQKYRRKFQMRQRMQQQQEQMAAQQEQALREEELAIQQEQLAFQRENSPVQLQGLKNKANLDKTLITSRTKLNDAKLKLLNSK